MTPVLLLSIKDNNPDNARRKIRANKEVDTAYCKVFGCSPTELTGLKEQYPTLELIRNATGKAESIYKKAELLQSYGVTKEEMKRQPIVLQTRLRVLKVTYYKYKLIIK